MTPDDLKGKATITVEEAGQLLGISRGAAYEAARRYVTSGGEEGLPAVRLGRRLLIPVDRLRTLLGSQAG